MKHSNMSLNAILELEKQKTENYGYEDCGEEEYFPTRDEWDLMDDDYDEKVCSGGGF